MSIFSDLIYWVKSRLWPTQAVKRRRDSVAEEEEDDIFLNFQISSKRPKRMTTPLPFNPNVMSDGANFPNTSSRPQNIRNIPIRVENKNSRQRMSQEVKENDPDIIEVIDLDSEHEQKPIERRPALANLAVRSKPRNLSADMALTKTPSPHPHKSGPDKKQLEISVAVPNTSKRLEINVTVPEKKQNGVHSSLYNSFASSHLQPSRTSTPKLTALNQTYKYADKLKYSQLLAEYHKLSRTALQDVPAVSTKTPSSLNGISPVTGPSRPQGSAANVWEVVDLTRDDSGDYFKRRSQAKRIPVKPYQPHATNNDDDDVKIIEERKLHCVNSLERKLSQNCHVSPEWIVEIQRKYGEKELEMRRQVEETVLKKELYAKHNEAKRMAAIDERIRRHLKITDVVLDETEPEEAALPELTHEMQEKINAALRPNPASEGLVEGFGQKITRRDIQTLNGLNWLNDEVINFYMNLIIERGKADKHMSVYAFNTFFYPKLVSQGYNTLRRWTKKVDIFNHELLLVPIHLGMHWCMATMDFRDSTVRYYDSMGGENHKCLHALLKYLNDESMDKKKTPYDTSNWNLVNMKDIPQQMNGSDCGMFSCMFAEYTSRNAKITFSQKDMPYFRRKMVYEILTKKLLL